MTTIEAFREAVTAWAAAGDPDGDGEAGARARAAARGVRTVVLLEGPSDLAAIEALAVGHGRDLAGEGVCVLPMGGAMSIRRFTRILGPTGLGLGLTGLCDENESPYYARELDTFSVCSADLEDELIRALGVPRVLQLVEEQGDLRALQTFQRQPAQQGRAPEQQLRRFLGTKKGRKIQYGRALTEALPTGRTPAPLQALLSSL
ncbi:ATP-dependent endonuclease [Streptomyces sp. LHD-70]|uniref:TOPRIM nucleotidyl transferase/hydrolase domain-containing protein n=1 Tax=Streptomyces sp. LHD-70 TaxID=3072140 RepID=UPI00280FA9AA|nr:TOPRIM nucleotidyl transferase/hydrolase domain-containing protein [Streptomyces sp. LHD-70]MDQ8705206.1 ATP-dependent endonuclease [Streptomyces sp. LHD-70]